VASPLLANLYLHYVLDVWVNSWRKKKARGDVMIVRYADDFVMGFQHREEAEAFRQELAERLGQFGLELHPDKTRLIEFGRYAVVRRKKRGQGKPETFDFLGFTHACGKNHKNGRFEVKRRTMAKRVRKKLQEIKQQLKRRRHESTATQAKWLQSVVRGYFQYHAIPGNWKVLDSFRRAVLRLWRRTLRRRSQRSHWTWQKFYERLAPAIPWPRIIHPYPLERFAAKHPR